MKNYNSSMYFEKNLKTYVNFSASEVKPNFVIKLILIPLNMTLRQITERHNVATVKFLWYKSISCLIELWRAVSLGSNLTISKRILTSFCLSSRILFFKTKYREGQSVTFSMHLQMLLNNGCVAASVCLKWCFSSKSSKWVECNNWFWRKCTFFGSNV